MPKFIVNPARPLQRGTIAYRLKPFFNGKVFSAAVLMLLLTVSVMPVGAVLNAQAASTLTFTAEADARVQQSNPSNNYGTANYLLVDGASNSDVESFIRFTVSGASGSVQSALLRVYVTTNASANGPAAYSANNNWTETGITWNNRPARTSGVLDNKGSTSRSSWVEYNVTAAVTGNGTYSFVLVADSSDAIRFSSREGSRAPQLVVTLHTATGTPTPTRTQTSNPPTVTATAMTSTTATPTGTGTPPPGATETNTPGATQAATSSPVATGTATAGSGSTITFAPNADARVYQLNPSTNYGAATTLQSDGNSGEVQISYIRFAVSGITGSIQSVKLRVFCTTNGTTNGPAVQLANNNWIESGSGGINWNNRPALIGAASDNKGAFASNSWVEYDVTALVTGNNTYTLALVADSTDGVVFSSREGAAPPQLVVTLATGAPTATFTETPPPATTATETSTPAVTPTNSPAPSNQVVVFNPSADSYVDENNPATNYGTQLQLRADSAPVMRSYLRFQVEGLYGTVTGATLRLFANSASSAGYEIRSVNDDTWTELEITYNNSPAAGSVLDISGSFNGGAWTTVDVTAYITGNGTYSLALTAPDTTAISFASREVGNNAPQLVVETQGGSAPTATATQTETATPAAPTSTPTASGSVILVGAGDITSCTRTQDDQTAQLLDNIPGTVFTAGDNAYVDGTYTEYLNCYDPTWGRHKSRTKPSPGNHDYLTSGAAGYFQYFNNMPSYYAYDLGAWRVYSLNSEISMAATSAQATWLQNDLATNPRQCVLAYWHKPRWSSGSNHGDTTAVQPIWQILYDAGADLVVNGHEHQYERFAEMNAAGTAVSQGLREIVAGTGGAGLYPFGTPDAASQVRNSTTYGVLKLTLRSNGYDWEFIGIPGSTFTDSGSSNCH